MFSRVKRYLYRFFCRIYRVCGIQSDVMLSRRSYAKPKILLNNFKEKDSLLLHRTLLWDECEPIGDMAYICSVRKYTHKIVHLLWNGKEVDVLMRRKGYEYYFDYPRRIMQADLARYAILYHYGGMYLDFDVSMHNSLDELFAETGLREEDGLPLEYCILFEEHRWKNKEEAVSEKEQPIRSFMAPEYHTEALVRVANYAMICTPGHPFMLKLIEECQRRAVLKPTCDYDVLFITGPDVVSHVYHICSKELKQKSNVVLISREKHHDFIVHHCAGGWRISKDNAL